MSPSHIEIYKFVDDLTLDKISMRFLKILAVFALEKVANATFCVSTIDWISSGLFYSA